MAMNALDLYGAKSPIRELAKAFKPGDSVINVDQPQYLLRVLSVNPEQPPDYPGDPWTGYVQCECTIRTRREPRWTRGWALMDKPDWVDVPKTFTSHPAKLRHVFIQHGAGI